MRSRYRVGAEHIDVITDDAAVTASLSQYYARSQSADATAEVRVSSGPVQAGDLVRGPFRGPSDIIGTRRDGDRSWTVRGSTSESRAIAARKLMRTVWLSDIWDSPFTVLHASAFAVDDRVLIQMSRPHGGKSTLLFDALMNVPGARYVANDALVLQPTPSGVLLTSLPVYVHAKPDMAREQLSWLEQRQRRRGLAPAPLSPQGSLEYTACILGSDPSPVLSLTAEQITWVLPEFLPRGSTGPASVAPAWQPVAEIVRHHTREDWMANTQADNFGLLPPREPARLLHDSAAITRGAGGDGAVRFQHHGSVAPLLAHLGIEGTERTRSGLG